MSGTCQESIHLSNLGHAVHSGIAQCGGYIQYTLVNRKRLETLAISSLSGKRHRQQMHSYCDTAQNPATFCSSIQ